jgi:hypothetical protein
MVGVRTRPAVPSRRLPGESEGGFVFGRRVRRLIKARTLSHPEDPHLPRKRTGRQPGFQSDPDKRTRA